MISEYWMWVNWFTKVVLYLSVAFVVGGAFCYFLLRQYLELKESILKYITIGAGLGLISSTLGFFILIGSFANAGITGMWDPTYINIVLNTSPGHAHILRSISFTLLLLLMVIKLSRNKAQFSITESSIFGVLLIPIIFSFSQLEPRLWGIQGLLLLQASTDFICTMRKTRVSKVIRDYHFTLTEIKQAQL